MPAPLLAISDDEESNPGVTSDITTSSTKKTRKSYKEPDEAEFDDPEDDAVPDTNQENGDDEEEDNNEDEDLDEDEYVVEKIFSHYIAEDVRWLAHQRGGGLLEATGLTL